MCKIVCTLQSDKKHTRGVGGEWGFACACVCVCVGAVVYFACGVIFRESEYLLLATKHLLNLLFQLNPDLITSFIIGDTLNSLCE